MKIEDLVFDEIGSYKYKLEEVKNLKPEHNVNGLIKIKDKFYKKIYNW